MNSRFVFGYRGISGALGQIWVTIHISMAKREAEYKHKVGEIETDDGLNDK